MIVFDLKCAHHHVFEAWFGSSDAYDAQSAAGQIACPMCGDKHVGKAVMAPNVATKGNRTIALPPPATMKAAIKVIAAAQAKALETSEWVGPTFADRARAMHLGEETRATIHGQATVAEAKALVDEGVQVTPLLIPVVPPAAIN